MKTVKKLEKLLKAPTQFNSTYTCSNGYVVDNKAELKYHIIIDSLFGEHGYSTKFTDDMEVIFEKLNQTERLELADVLLDHFFYLKEKDTNYHQYFYIEDSTILIFKYLDKNEEAYYIQYLKRYNDSTFPLDFVEERELLERLTKLAKKQKLSPSLLEILDFRYSLYIKSDEHLRQRIFILTAKLLGRYNSVDIIRQDLDKDFATGKIEREFEDGYPLSSNDPYYQEQLMITQILEIEKRETTFWRPLTELKTIQKIVQESREVQKNFVMALFYRMAWQVLEDTYDHETKTIATLISKKRLPFTEADMIFGIELFLHPKMHKLPGFNFGNFFKNVEKFTKTNEVSPALKIALEALAKPELGSFDKDFQKLNIRAKEILMIHFEEMGNIVPYLLVEGDSFGQMVNAEIVALNQDTQSKWYEMFRHAATAKSGKPSKKMLEKASKLIDDIGKENFINRLKPWLAFLVKMETNHANDWYAYFMDSGNIPVAKGLVWSLSLCETSVLDEDIERLIVRCYKKIPGIGPSCAALGNACIYYMSTKNSLEAVALLNRAKSKIAQRNTKALINKYIQATATELNISVADLEDFSIPDFGLKEGTKTIAFNDYSARLSIAVFGKTKLEWIKPDGKLQKSIPSFVRKDFAEELKAIRSQAKLIPKTLTIQRDRLDRSYIQKRRFSFEHFQQYFANHGLMSFLTKKLIWTFQKDKQKSNAIWFNGNWQDVEANQLDWIDDQTQINLWHPLDSDTEEILKWRDFLQEKEIKQPLKQAYREVYILTDAEINTKNYSNRMAAHILKQHQFNALAGIRNWKYQLLGAYDDGRDGEVCSIQIPDYDIHAEYWINEVSADDAFNDTGIWLYVATDQVRFIKDDELMDLVDVPKLVFSEIMRDVDLFVGVASVGNDPQWQDNGGLPMYRTYWESYSFGDLTALAKTRKDILEKLLPRLKIANIATIDGKFLIVKGSKRTYKIHIGSTNILMEPNDQYLCIVPDRSASKSGEKLFIPFEGDRGLSILLSKAFLLAEDDKITDTTILSQINP